MLFITIRHLNLRMVCGGGGQRRFSGILRDELSEEPHKILARNLHHISRDSQPLIIEGSAVQQTTLYPEGYGASSSKEGKVVFSSIAAHQAFCMRLLADYSSSRSV
jgi:hypothetical protein